MTCAKCGQRCQGKYCKPCARDERRELGPTGGETVSEKGSSDDKAWRCTDCGEDFTTADPGGGCPHCGAYRRRYIGPMEGEV